VAGNVIGIDLGGTNTRVALVDARSLEVRGEERLASNVSGGPERLIRRIAAAVAALGGEPLAVGVGVAGLIEPASGTILFSPNFPGWEDYPLGPELSRLTGLRAAVENDANMAALGEQRAGAARGINNVVCLTLGTGVGGGFVFEGRLYRGARGQAGEVGHLTIEPKGGALCGCGRRGCLETIASATGLIRLAREGMARGRKTSLKADDLSARAIAQAAESGDRLARSLYQRMGKALGFALAQLVNLLDLEAAVLAGGVSAAWPLFMPALETELHRWLLPRKEVRVLRTGLGEAAGVVGAACVARDLVNDRVEGR
jgi:glucokinase